MNETNEGQAGQVGQVGQAGQTNQDANTLQTLREKTKLPVSPYIIAASMAFGFSAMMFLMSIAYIKDLETLKSTPEAVWLFVCGVPTDNPIILPILLLIGGGGVVIGIVLLVINRFLRGRVPRLGQQGQQSEGKEE